MARGTVCLLSATGPRGFTATRLAARPYGACRSETTARKPPLVKGSSQTMTHTACRGVDKTLVPSLSLARSPARCQMLRNRCLEARRATSLARSVTSPQPERPPLPGQRALVASGICHTSPAVGDVDELSCPPSLTCATRIAICPEP